MLLKSSIISVQFSFYFPGCYLQFFCICQRFWISQDQIQWLHKAASSLVDIANISLDTKKIMILCWKYVNQCNQPQEYSTLNYVIIFAAEEATKKPQKYC